jgi:anti-repressor protein
MSDSSIQQFKSEQFGTIRTTTIDGEPWFVAKDVCAALGFTHQTDATKHLEDDEKGVTICQTPGGPQKMLTVSEPGLYSLIMRSRKPEAHAFKRWVTHEVLPSIRRDGGYMVVREDESDEQVMARALLIAQKAITAKDKHIAELEPKARFADAVAASDGTCLVGELAKMLRQNGVDVGQNRLFAKLREDGFLGKVGQNRNVPTQRAMDMGLFRIKETAVTHSDGHTTITRTPKVTGKGQTYFMQRYEGGIA